MNKDALIDAINQVFSLFSLNYHNQYYAAFKEQALEVQAKRLWFESLQNFEPAAILAATKAIILESEYLPTLSKMVAQCERHSNAALPEPRAAYVEACQAPSPKAGYQWSHPAVYYAGLACDWFFLASTPESTALPIFKQHYRELCERVRNGEELKAPKLKELPSPQESVLTREENQQRLAALRAKLDL
ncbi:replication protein P [Sessilibacter sp. MAH1]